MALGIILLIASLAVLILVTLSSDLDKDNDKNIEDTTKSDY